MQRIAFILILAIAIATPAADFERSNWRTQLYFQVEPYSLVQFSGDGEFLNESIDTELWTIPLSLGFLWSPLFTPAFKLDVPFTIWLGIEAASFQFKEIQSYPEYKFPEGSVERDGPSRNEILSFYSVNPAVLGGFSFNIAGDFDLRVLGGFGVQRYSFKDEFLDVSREKASYHKYYFVSGALEYRIAEIFEDGDLKIGINVRKEFEKRENVIATNSTKNEEQVGIPNGYSGVEFESITNKLPVRVALELSLEFGKESRRDRKVRFALFDRDSVLRKNSEVKDTLSDWDCMAIERDYKLFLEDGDLPDVSASFTKVQFADVLESYLAFCKPADLNTKEHLYSALDSSKVNLKQYQVKQEDSRYQQVMASNDLEMMQMFLQYYPETPHREAIEAKIKVISDYQVFKAAQKENS
ncbi:MAG TPA: hypothetical protein PLT31_05650, partial [Fibrobacteraceae bacterium]|nr:hypothetical protein [Fibrobacteraceae bacterium]